MYLCTLYIYIKFRLDWISNMAARQQFKNQLGPITPELMAGFSTGLFGWGQRLPYGSPTPGVSGLKD
jgi:hypothetical protein